MTTLKEARKTSKLEQFIQEHEKDTPGDLDKLDAAIKRPVWGNVTSGQEASKPGG